MRAHPGRTAVQDRVEMTEDERTQFASILTDPKWDVFRRFQLARCTMIKDRLYKHALSGTKDFDTAPLAAYLCALEDTLSPTNLVKETSK